MRVAIIAICLLVMFAGCIQYQEPQPTATDTPTPSGRERIQQSATTPSEPSTPSAKYDTNVSMIEQSIHQKMNERRVRHNVSKLDHSQKLHAIARYKSWDMAKYDYFSHDDHLGNSHTRFRSEYNSTCDSYGQNLHRLKYNNDMVDVQEELSNEEEIANGVVNSLMNSTGHRENILNPAYDVEGIGVFVDENGTVFVTQEFCGYR